MFIVGAVEVSPGWMKVEHLGIDDQVHTSHIYTNDYLNCFKNQTPSVQTVGGND